MSTCTLKATWAIMQRACTAEPDSPIAAIKSTGKFTTTVKPVFASTIMVRDMIRRNDPNLIGIYDKTSEPSQIKADIKAAFG